MEPQFIKSFIQVVKEQIVKENRVQIDGLGQFHKVHQTQTQKKLDDGRVVLMPPKDKIEFKPEISHTNDDR
ncbi:HU family DNA-binding protein [Rhodohalobacter sp. 8-1]|uniref:HU family DNA-binding protein n=1 Tax=Rhodohalobacter sp. 8-1 TaxID=3131972 RepID=UPI0030EE5E24